MRQQETASHYSLGRPPLIPTNPLSIFPSLATEAAEKITRPDLELSWPDSRSINTQQVWPFSLGPTLHFIAGLPEKEELHRQSSIDVPVNPFVQGLTLRLSSTIFVSASLLRFMAFCFDKANVCHRHDKNDTGDVCF